MKYVLMMIMFVCSLGICFIVNKGKEQRIAVLKEIKQSMKAFDIHQYFLSLDAVENKHFSYLSHFADEVAASRLKTKDAMEQMMKDMDSIFMKKSDSSMLLRWLSLVKNPDNSTKRDEVEKQCNSLIEVTKSEEKTNVYIALAIGIVLIIILI